MSASEEVEISEDHIGNPNILRPIEELIERTLEKYTPGEYGPPYIKTDPSTAKERHREKAIKWFSNRNIHFLGQLLIGAFFESHYSHAMPLRPFRMVIEELGFKFNQYNQKVAFHPELRKSLIEASAKFNLHPYGYYYLCNTPHPFAGKSREEIGNALKVMFQIDAPIPEPGAIPDRSKIFAVKAAHNSPTVETQGIKIALSERWFLQAPKVYQPAMLEQFLKAIGDDPYIQAEIGAAKNAAIRGEELQHRETKADEINMLAFDSTPLQSGLKALFGDASEPLADLVDRNLRARSSQIQEKARFIMDQQVIAAFSPKR